jgi:hypothetical protein
MTSRPILGLLLLSTAVFAARLAGAQELVPNPEFDVAATTGWTGDIASLSWSQDESECLPPFASGSLLLVPDNLDGPSTAFACLAAPAPGGVNLTFLVRADCEEVVKGKLRFYPLPACDGAPGGVDEIGGTTPGGTWDEAGLFNVPVPLGTQSVWLGLEISQATTQICNTRFDKIHLGPGSVIQRSGFETGSTDCRWFAVP